MTRKLLAIVVFAMLAASCGPGPLPAIPSRYDPPRDRFPSKSEDPRALDIAIREDRLDDVRRLLDAGADPNARWGSGDHHPLQETIAPYTWMPVEHKTEIVRLLLAHGADPNLRWCPFESRLDGPWWDGCTSAAGMTPLIAAAAFDLTEIVELLLADGADPTLKAGGASALDHASGEITFELIARRLFPNVSTRNRDALASLEQYDGYARAMPSNATLLSRAIGGNHMSWLTPPPIPPAERQGVSWYSHRLDVGRVRLLLNIGADPNERVTLGGVDWTPLALALATSRSWTPHVLLRGGADPNARWCFKVDWELTTKPRAKDSACNTANGITPLMEAASRSQADLVRALLEYGADPTLTNWNGKSAADLATTEEVRKLLSQRHP